ncbi:Mth938-like domain-containing protein, partial [Pseudomonadota bacterium]
MDLILDQPGNYHFIRSVTEKGIQVGDEFFREPFIMNAEHIIPHWPVSEIELINEQHLEQVMELEPEVVLIGTGAKQKFLDPKQMMLFYSRNIGLEVMTTDAACRT